MGALLMHGSAHEHCEVLLGRHPLLQQTPLGVYHCPGVMAKADVGTSHTAVALLVKEWIVYIQSLPAQTRASQEQLDRLRGITVLVIDEVSLAAAVVTEGATSEGIFVVLTTADDGLRVCLDIPQWAIPQHGLTTRSSISRSLKNWTLNDVTGSRHSFHQVTVERADVINLSNEGRGP